MRYHSIIRPEPDEKSLAHRSVQITPVSISVTENILAGIENVIPELFTVKPFISTLPTDYKQVIMNDPSTISHNNFISFSPVPSPKTHPEVMTVRQNTHISSNDNNRTNKVYHPVEVVVSSLQVNCFT